MPHRRRMSQAVNPDRLQTVDDTELMDGLLEGALQVMMKSASEFKSIAAENAISDNFVEERHENRANVYGHRFREDVGEFFGESDYRKCFAGNQVGKKNDALTRIGNHEKATCNRYLPVLDDIQFEIGKARGIFENELVDQIWLGEKRVADGFQWAAVQVAHAIDGENVRYDSALMVGEQQEIVVQFKE